MAGAPPPISYRKIVSSLFQNLKYKYDRSATEPVTKAFYFAAGVLTEAQAKQITYPVGMTALNRYITYQVNLTQGEYHTYVVALATKDKYIYGIYYRVRNVPKLSRRYIRDSPTPISLPDDVVLVNHLYQELYTKVESTPVILGISRGNIAQASLQFSSASRYFSVYTDYNGIVPPPDPEVEKTGLSRSLRSAECDC